MKKFLKFLGIIVLVFAIYSGLSVLLRGNTYHFETTTTIKAPKEKVWEYVGSMKAFNQWNPWLKIDKNMKIVYSGTAGQVGDQYCWDSQIEAAGAGCQKIIELVPGEKQKTEMLFKKPFEGEATSDLILTSEGNFTKITWTMETEQDAMMKVMKPLMDYQMGKSYDEGLQNLKALIEK